MSVIWPERFTPQGLGQPTKLNLPGVATSSTLSIATVAPGVTVTHSYFFAAEGRAEDIRRQADTVLVVVGLEGTTGLNCPDTGRVAEINAGDCWLIHPSRKGVGRRIAANIKTSSFVISIRQDEVLGALRFAVSEFVESGDVFAQVKTSFAGFEAFRHLFQKQLSGPELLEAEVACMGVLAQVFAAYSTGSQFSLKTRISDYLAPRLATKVALNDIARHIGMNRSKLNEVLRAETGQTVFELLREMRVKRARQLQDQGLSMAQIAHEAGFSSASHLCRALKAANDTLVP